MKGGKQMEKILTEILKVDGMTCHNCENTIEKAISKLAGVVKVKASFKTRNVIIKYDANKLSKKDIVSSIEKVGYTPVTEGNNKFVVVAFIIMFGLYLIFKNTNVFNFIPKVEDNIGYGLLFVVGLLTSVHCIAMCGGINIAVSMNSGENNKFKFGSLYNLGRIVSYTIIGGIAGALGSTISFSSMAKDIISVGAGIFMIIIGINITSLFKNINVLRFHLPKRLAKFFNRQKKNTKSPFIVGMLNGLMPCGPLQTMQIYALGTGSLIVGALSMFMFGLGTMPLMLGLSSLGGVMSGKMGVNLKKLSGVLVVVLGIVMFNRGFDYSFISNLTKQTIDLDNVTVSEIKDGYQEVTTRFENGSYQPIVVQKGIPVKWTIIMKNGDLNGCNDKIEIVYFDISKELSLGDNEVMFTPDKTGTFKYTCWMHMLSSYIYVVDSVATIEQ